MQDFDPFSRFCKAQPRGWQTGSWLIHHARELPVAIARICANKQSAQKYEIITETIATLPQNYALTRSWLMTLRSTNRQQSERFQHQQKVSCIVCMYKCTEIESETFVTAVALAVHRPIDLRQVIKVILRRPHRISLPNPHAVGDRDPRLTQCSSGSQESSSQTGP